MGWFANYTIENLINDSFRPRLEMGWFGTDDETYITQIKFSSPLGDGLVLQILTEILKNQVIRYRHNKQL